MEGPQPSGAKSKHPPWVDGTLTRPTHCTTRSAHHDYTPYTRQQGWAIFLTFFLVVRLDSFFGVFFCLRYLSLIESIMQMLCGV